MADKKSVDEIVENKELVSTLLAKFWRADATLNIAEIQLPLYATRDLREYGVRTLTSSIMSRGYLPAHRILVEEIPESEHVANEQGIVCKYAIIDGAHRLSALRQVNRTLPDKGFDLVPACIYKTGLSNIDKLRIGSR